MHILLAEDDQDTARLLVDGLRARGHQIVHTELAETAIAALAEQRFDVAIFDRMLPGINGIEAIKQLRAKGHQLPVLMLTALGGVIDRVDGLYAGADDYMVKPFSMMELVARLHALARRSPFVTGDTHVEAAGFRLNLLTREVWRNGATIALQPRENQLLEHLLRHAGRVVTRTMFLEKVWGFTFDPQTNIVESHMSRLRGKLRAAGGDPIETIRGSGYRMPVDVERG